MHQIEEYWLVCALRARRLAEGRNRALDRHQPHDHPRVVDAPSGRVHCSARHGELPDVRRGRSGDRPTGAYAYLLCLYLGDGCVSATAKPAVFKLRITLDVRYVALNRECVEAMESVMARRVTAVQREGCVEFVSHSKHWPCLFPQHGPGRKHERKIELVDWQQAIADAHPKELLGGLIHSDGCRAINRVQHRKYAYPRYFFSNRSDDVHAIFRHACDLLGVTWRQNNASNTNVARRADVAFLDSFIGSKR